MIAYILVAVSETAVVLLTIYKGYRHMLNTRKSWVKHVYRHVITMANVIIPIYASEPKYKNYLVVPQRVFHSIFCNRVVLLIEGQVTRRRLMAAHLSRARTVSKSNYTANIMEMETNIEGTRYTTHGGPDLDMDMDLDDDTQIMEMSTYHHQDWTM
ncbi:hypothetical protein JR316_0012524 [Psilocybe cubensis]|uniref:Uncharacterized protein n=1 Tax=Psilocybe cubensis TaxID=181762 RepID=A0ACB8GI84_PSICU|nr:hypothetical protein JR316_0012524 [Psilocybe cubensis]KAH9475413.1 hypothetical protein JR316_0012524 [Psilocybe cubensis]